jgi:hypothetical protein
LKPPPKTKAKKPKKAASDEAPTNWQEQFFKLAEVLGKNPEEMITAYCRDWVEKTRERALAEGDDE